MINLKNIQSLTNFKRYTNESLAQLKKTKSPLVLTVNGKAELVVLEADEFDALLERLEHADNVRAIQTGIDSFERGESRPAREALEDLKRKYDL
jgi:PHD/YefM family antitoxin component YafN of YafNO toxin-antitoxin module